MDWIVAYRGYRMDLVLVWYVTDIFTMLFATNTMRA